VVRIALDQRAVTCIVVPNDLASQKAVDAPPHEHGTRPLGDRLVPSTGDLERAARVLNESENARAAPLVLQLRLDTSSCRDLPCRRHRMGLAHQRDIVRPEQAGRCPARVKTDRGLA
jgi:hypothetical protein